MTSKEYKIINNGSNVTYIYLSSLGTKPGFFSFFKIAKKNHGNYIFLNDSDNNWYLNGIKGLGNSAQSTISEIQKIILELGSDENIFIGDSMGAFGALYYGLSIKGTTKILAISPELELCINGGFSKRHLNNVDNPSHIKKHLLNLIIENTAVKIEIIAGELFSSDIYSLLSIVNENNCNITTIKNSFHTVSLFIHNDQGIHNIVHDLTYKGEFSITNSGDLLDYPEIAKQFYFSQHKKTSFNIKSIKTNNILKSSNDTLSLFFYLKYLHLKGENWEDAVLYLRTAASLNPKNLIYCQSLVDMSISDTIEKSLDQFDYRLIGQPIYRDLLKKILQKTAVNESYHSFMVKNKTHLKNYSEFNFI